MRGAHPEESALGASQTCVGSFGLIPPKLHLQVGVLAATRVGVMLDGSHACLPGPPDKGPRLIERVEADRVSIISQ
jgi:hypothetical protein